MSGSGPTMSRAPPPSRSFNANLTATPQQQQQQQQQPPAGNARQPSMRPAQPTTAYHAPAPVRSQPQPHSHTPSPTHSDERRDPSPVSGEDEPHSGSSHHSSTSVRHSNADSSSYRRSLVDSSAGYTSAEASRRRPLHNRSRHSNNIANSEDSPHSSPLLQSSNHSHSHEKHAALSSISTHNGLTSRLLSSYVKPSTKKKVARFIRDNRLDLVVKLFLSFVLSLLLLRQGYHMYEDHSKSSDFTIISLLHEMTPETLITDKTQFVFQWTALSSWYELVPGANIIIYVDTQESCDYLQSEFRGLQCYEIPCWHRDYRRPFLSCIFEDAHGRAQTDTFVYVNSDIVLSSDLPATLHYIFTENSKSMMVSRRTDTVLSQAMIDDFKAGDFLSQVRAHATNAGRVHESHVIDLFIYRQSLLPPTFTFPPFLAGVYKWDQWFLSYFILDESVTVIDATESIRAIHLKRNRESVYDTLGTKHNDNLITNELHAANSLKIGDINNTPFKIVGQCQSDGGCTVQSNDQVTDLIVFSKRASKQGYLVVLTVNSGYIPLALNWVCWAERIHFNNYILIAEDKAAGRKFTARGIPVITRANAPETKEAADYGSVAFQETMTFRTEFLASVLSAGYHFVTADMDGLWLDDPIPFFDHSADLQGQLHKEVKISGGFVVVRSTPYGKFFWNQVIECQRANSAYLATATPGSYEPSMYTEQYCINELSRMLLDEPKFRRSLLDRYIFPDGKSFFDEYNSQYRGIAPAIIHNNWIKGADNKLNRMKDWNLHSADEEVGECLPTPSTSLPILNNQSIHVKLRVMTYNRPDSLARLLESLKGADYLGESVSLELSVDHPVSSPDDDDVVRWKKTLQLAQSFQWRHGNKTVIEQQYNIGLVGQWTRGWQPSIDDDRTLVFFIEDDVAVSPQFYRWLRKAVDRYYIDPSQFDSRMFGISLQRQNRIIGETHTHQYGSRIPADILGNKFSLYRYQLIGTWGTLFFPQHWREFQSWLTEKQVDVNSGESASGFKPCVPTLHSNTWYLENPAKTWSQWFIRFAYERGWYSLYSHYPNDRALVVNYREPGLNSAVKKDAIGDLIASLTDSELALPDIVTIPVYDFHFNLIHTPDILTWRQYINNPKYIDQCWTISHLNGLLRERQLAFETEQAAKAKAKEEKRKAAEAVAKAKAKEEKERKANLVAERKANQTKTATPTSASKPVNVNATKAAANKSAPTKLAAPTKPKAAAPAKPAAKPSKPAKPATPPPAPATEEEAVPADLAVLPADMTAEVAAVLQVAGAVPEPEAPAADGAPVTEAAAPVEIEAPMDVEVAEEAPIAAPEA